MDRDPSKIINLEKARKRADYSKKRSLGLEVWKERGILALKFIILMIMLKYLLDGCS